MLKYANFLSTSSPLPTPFDLAPHCAQHSSFAIPAPTPLPPVNKLSFFDDCNTWKKLETIFMQNFGRDIQGVLSGTIRKW